jgi:hypothetical protein
MKKTTVLLSMFLLFFWNTAILAKTNSFNNKTTTQIGNLLPVDFEKNYSCIKGDEPFVGRVVKTIYDNKSHHIIAFVILVEKGAYRYKEKQQINIELDYEKKRLSEKKQLKRELSFLLRPGNLISVTDWGCGAKGSLVIAEKIELLR